MWGAVSRLRLFSSSNVLMYQKRRSMMYTCRGFKLIPAPVTLNPGLAYPGQDSLFAARLLRDRAIAVHMGSNALRGHGESAPSEHAMRILTLRSPSVAQGQWRRGSRMGLRGAVDAQGLAPGCAGARARRRPCQQLGCPSSRGLSPRSAGRPGPGQARRALPLGGAACDGTSGRAVGRAGDAIWWALHGLRCSSGAYAHI